MHRFKTEELFDLSHSLAGSYLKEFEYPWSVLPNLKKYIEELIEILADNADYRFLSDGVLVSESAEVSPLATVCAPCVIGPRSELRTGAYIRGSVIVGESCVVGNSCEIKNSVLFDRAQVPHFNYIGDSILGYRAHTGAGAITSNVKSDKTLVTVKCDGIEIETGMKKLGAMIGDFAEIGCNCVLNPGTVIGRNTSVYPLSSVRGVVAEDCIYKSADNIVPKNKKR